MNIILLGPPGAGKGTLAANLARDKGVIQIAPGDILRNHIDKRTQLGRKAASYLETGQLLPIEIIKLVLNDCLTHPDIHRGFIGDGLVRNVLQAEALDQVLYEANLQLDFAINIELTNDEAITRLQGRKICTNCGKIYNIYNAPPKKTGVCDLDESELLQRSDDVLPTILKRLQVYNENCPSVIDYYKSRSLLRTVDGMNPIKFVEEAVKILIGSDSTEALQH